MADTTQLKADGDVRMIPMDRINVVNPRVRNSKIFKEIVGNIAEIGLKRPITVARRNDEEGERYDLVCGQGRLEAYRELGQDEIPALIIEADEESSLIMSLVENLARRQHRAIDLLHDIEGMKKRGHSVAEIVRMTGLTEGYIRGVIHLLAKGEQRLLRAVEAGQIPVSVAVDIAEADDEGAQKILQQAYETNVLRGKRLMSVKRLIDQRRKQGKTLRVGVGSAKKQRTLTLESVLKTYRDDADKKRLLVRKAEATRERLLFVLQALRVLLADENFQTLLRAEGLDTLPRNLGDRMLSAEGQS